MIWLVVPIEVFARSIETLSNTIYAMISAYSSDFCVQVCISIKDSIFPMELVNTVEHIYHEYILS